jgi:hypothetical protein
MITIQTLQKKYVVPKSVKKSELLQGAVCSIKAGNLLWKEVQPGKLHILSLAQFFDIEAKKSLQLMNRKVGEMLRKGDVIARKKSLLSFFNQELKAPTSGVFEDFHEPSASVFFRELPKEILFHSPMSGDLHENDNSITIESFGLCIQGAYGEGSQCFGVFQWSDDFLKNPHQYEAPLVLGLKNSVIEPVISLSNKIKAVIAASLSLSDIKMLNDRGVSVVITEGVGSVTMSNVLMGVLDKCIGKEVSVFPQTKVYAGAIRPTIFCSDVSELRIPEKKNIYRGIRTPFLGVYGILENAIQDSLQLKNEQGQSILIQKQNSSSVFLE